MFYIQINGKKVNLGVDFRIDLVIENPLFLTDRIPFAYTTSADLPMTPDNLALLQHPDRVNLTPAGRKWEFDGAILGYGARPLYYGLFIVQEIRQQISWSFQASDDLSEIRKDMNQIEWGQEFFGNGSYAERTAPDWTPEGGTASVPLILYRQLWRDVRDGLRLFTAAPIKTAEAGFNTKFEDDELVYVNALFGQNNFFNAWSNVAGNLPPLDFDPITATITRYGHSPMYPQLRAYQICKRLLGLADADNPFHDPDLYRVVITSHYHPKFRDDLVQKWSGILLDNDYPAALSFAEMWLLKLASYQPAKPASQILKSLLNVIAGTVFRYQEAGQAVYKIKLAKDLIADTTFQNWDGLLGTKLWLSREQGQLYRYGYDGYDEENPAIDPQFVLPAITNLITAPVNEETGEQLYYIQTTRQLILKKLSPKAEPSDPDIFVYEVRHSGLESPSASEGFEITSSLTPLKMVPTANLDVFHNPIAPPSTLAYLPIYEGTRQVSYTPHLMIYWGNLENRLNPPFLVPYLSYHNYDAGGNRLGDISLQWGGPDGLINRFHKDFKRWVERDKLVGYGEFIFSPYFLRDIDLAKKVLVRGKKWWIKKMVIPLSMKKIEPAQVDLIEAEDPLPDDSGSGSSGSGSGGGSGSGSGGGGIPGSGTCYTFTIDSGTFDPVADYFSITIQRPGEAETTAGFDAFTRVNDGMGNELITVCSETVPVLRQSGTIVASVNGVSVTAGGDCSSDSDCSM